MANPPLVARLAPGALVAKRYRLTRQIGEGAMGAVWAAVDEVITREVALKLLLRPDPEHRHRLLREARACGALKHKNIIDVFDIMETETGEPFLVMQLLSGETLGDLLARKRRLEQEEAALIGRDVARALSAAHALQIIHRDLKPANIFLHQEPDVDGYVVKVLDFGIAKNLGVSDGLHTVAGGAVGSPFYMSPEQVRGDPSIDPRADIWALGVVLFEMLTGIRPFQGDTPEVFAKILTGETPSVTRYVRRIDDRLAQVVTRCLSRARELRFPTVADVIATLDLFVPPPAPYGLSSTTPPPTPTMSLPAGMAPFAAPPAPPALPALPGAAPPVVAPPIAAPPVVAPPVVAPPAPAVAPPAPVTASPAAPAVPGGPPRPLPRAGAGIGPSAPAAASLQRPGPVAATTPLPRQHMPSAPGLPMADFTEQDDDDVPTAFYKPDEVRGSSPSLPEAPATARWPEGYVAPALGTPLPGAPPRGLAMPPGGLAMPPGGLADPPTDPGWASGGTVRMDLEDASRYRLGEHSPPFQGGNIPPAPPPPPGMQPGYGPMAGGYAPPGPHGYGPPGSPVTGQPQHMPGTDDGYPPAPAPMLGQPGFPPGNRANTSTSPFVGGAQGAYLPGGAPPLNDENPFARGRLSRPMLALLAGLVIVLGIISVSLIMVLTDSGEPAPAPAGSGAPGSATAAPTAPPPTAEPAPPPDPASTAEPSAPEPTATPGTPPQPTAVTPTPRPSTTTTAKPVKRDCSKLRLLERQRCERGY